MKHFLTTIFILVILTACGPKKDAQTGKMELKDLNGKAIDLADYRGKTLFINIWATWCKPCIEEMPSIASAQQVLKGKNIEFLFASDEGKERIENFEAKRNLGLHYVGIESLEALQINALPHTYIIDSGGEIVFSEPGFRQWDTPENIDLLNKIIEGND